MPLFTRKGRGRNVSTTSSSFPSPTIEDEPQFASPPREQEVEIQDPWLRREVAAEEVQELLHICTEEMKSRGKSGGFEISTIALTGFA